MTYAMLTGAVMCLFAGAMALSVTRQKTVFTVSVLFTSVWVLVMLANGLQQVFKGYNDVSSVSYELLFTGIVSMTVGCFTAQLLFGRPRQTAESITTAYMPMKKFLNAWFPVILAITFLTGVWAFFSTGIGLDFSFNQLGDIRDSYLEGGSQTLGVQIARYATNLAFAAVVMLAASDFARSRVSMQRLVLLCCSVLPLSLSKASRTEFVQIALYYFCAVFVLSALRQSTWLQRERRGKLIRRVSIRAVVLLLMLGLVFAYLGVARSAARYADVSSPVERMLLPITSYLSSSVFSVGPLSHWIENNIGASGGGRYFEAPNKILEQFGASTLNSKNIVRTAYDDIGWIAITPGTFVRHLVADFGLKAMPYVSFAIGFLSTAATLRIPFNTLPAFGCVTLIVFDLAYSFQVIGLFSVGNLYKIGVLFALAYAYRRYQTKYERRLRSRQAVP